MICIRCASVAPFHSEQVVVWSGAVFELLLLNSVARELLHPSIVRPEWMLEPAPQPKASVGLVTGAGWDWPLFGLGGCWNQSQPTGWSPVLWGPPQLNS